MLIFSSIFLACLFFLFFFKQKTAYEMRISDWSSDVCSSDLDILALLDVRALQADDERDREVHFLGRGDDALGDDIALHDAAKDEIGRASCRERVCQYV